MKNSQETKLLKVENKGKNKGWDNLIPLKKGQTANPNGRPLGQRNYATLYRDALIKLGQLNNKEPTELETEMISNALKLAREGSYSFYKDTLDRLHGQAQVKADITTAGESMNRTEDEKLELLAKRLSEELKNNDGLIAGT